MGPPPMAKNYAHHPPTSYEVVLRLQTLRPSRYRLRAIKAQRIQANKPCWSICLQTRQVWRYQHLIFREEGFIDPRDSVEEFPSCGWQRVWVDPPSVASSHSEGDDESEGDTDPQGGPSRSTIAGGNGLQDSVRASDRSTTNTEPRPSPTWRGTTTARSHGPMKRDLTQPRPKERLVWRYRYLIFREEGFFVLIVRV